MVENQRSKSAEVYKLPINNNSVYSVKINQTLDPIEQMKRS